MLRITIEEGGEQFRLKLEGRLAGAWVTELENCWRTAASTLCGRPLWVDLTAVDCVDAAGKYLLALMHNAGARFIASGCAMLELVREITGDWPVGHGPKTGGANTL